MNHYFKPFTELSSEYTQFPFWFWNDALDFEQIKESMEDFKAKGVDGVIIHPRMGLSEEIGYLTETYFEYVSCAVEKAAQLEMKVVLYDEGMYPSGSAHGEIVRNHPELASKGCVMLKKFEMNQYPYEPIRIIETYSEEEETVLLYGPSGGTIRGVHVGEDDSQHPPASADLLHPETAPLFIAYTHEKYYERLSTYFGNTIIGFFTDEPDILGRNAFPGMIPWTDEMVEKLAEAGIGSEALPQLFQSDTPAKQIYDDIIVQLLSQNYYAVLSKWCEDHDISLMGHPHGSMDIGYLEHFQIPGQDMVWRWVGPGERGGITGRDSTAAKCSADAARHLGRRRNSNEIFGCCGPDGKQWAFTLSDMKWYLDWLFIRGVNLIIPHAFFYSLRGIRGEDRPPDVGPHNIWWPHYRIMAQYSKRMSWLMTDAVNQTNIAVLCKKDDLPWKEVIPFWEEQMEFNYVEEKYLDQLPVKNGWIEIGAQRYNVLAVADGFSFLTKQKIAALEKKGLTIIPIGEVAEMKRNALYRPALSTSVPQIRYSQIVKEGRTFYLFSNEGEELCEFEWRAPDCLLELQAMTGEIYTSPTQNGSKQVKLYPRELKIFTEKRNDEEYPLLEVSQLKEVQGNIQVKTEPFSLSDFSDWTTIDPAYSGEVCYHITVTIPPENENRHFVLDLGAVNDIVRFVSIDGTETIIFTAPYQIPLETTDENGKIEIEVYVQNSLTNQYEANPRSSGILGPVNVLEKS